MIFILGGLLAAGLLLTGAPWLWPPREAPAEDERRSATERLLERAGCSSLTPRAFAAVSLGCAVAGAACTWLLVPVAILAATAGCSAAAAPYLLLNRRAARLRRSRSRLWPDVCDLLVASVRAGMGLSDAVASLSMSAPAPLRSPFAQFARDIAASGHFESASARLKAALADPVADRIVETLVMARRVGGTELTPVLRALSASVRAEIAVRAEVEARQSWIRGAAVLGVIAPWVILLLLGARPEGIRAYSSPEGMVLIVVGAGVSFVAYRLIMRIGRLPEPRRWFA